MIFLSILIFILAMSLPFFKTQITPIFFTRIAALAFIYAGALTFNALHIQSIGSGIGIYSGLFQVTYYSLFIETFLYVIGAIILLSWALVKSLDSKESDNHILSYEGSSLESVPAQIYKNTPPYSLPLRAKGGNRIKEGGKGGNYSGFSVTTSIESREYSLIALFSTLGGSFLISSGDLLSMYLSIELQSFGLYILATIYKDSGSATSAGLKYFLLGGLSSCLILLGAALVYTYTGLTSFESIYSLVSVLSMSHEGTVELSTLGSSLGGEVLEAVTPSLTENISQGLSLGLILIVVGFLFKIAGAPFHNWAPDVYDESPTNVTIWLTIMPKISIILFLLELEMGIALNLAQPLILSGSLFSADVLDSYLQVNVINGGYVLKNIFLLSSLLSLIIGTVVGLAQIRIKRLLAYSTVSHIGFLLLALAINTEQSTESLIFYLIQYTITNLNTFFILLAFGYIINSSLCLPAASAYINSDIKFIFDLKGQFLSNPVLSLSLAVCLFSMAGIPPLIGFFGKQSVLSSAIGSGYFFMAFVAIVVSVISASYYLRIIRELHSETIAAPQLDEKNALLLPNHSLASLKPLVPGGSEGLGAGVESKLNLTNIHSFIIATLTLSILFFVLKPSIILNSTVLLSLSLFNG
jgi:NADH-ubiquinone oxidoreductase chain 2